MESTAAYQEDVHTGYNVAETEANDGTRAQTLHHVTSQACCVWTINSESRYLWGDVGCAKCLAFTKAFVVGRPTGSESPSETIFFLQDAVLTAIPKTGILAWGPKAFRFCPDIPRPAPANWTSPYLFPGRVCDRSCPCVSRRWPIYRPCASGSWFPLPLLWFCAVRSSSPGRTRPRTSTAPCVRHLEMYLWWSQKKNKKKTNMFSCFVFVFVFVFAPLNFQSSNYCLFSSGHYCCCLEFRTRRSKFSPRITELHHIRNYMLATQIQTLPMNVSPDWSKLTRGLNLSSLVLFVVGVVWSIDTGLGQAVQFLTWTQPRTDLLSKGFTKDLDPGKF